MEGEKKGGFKESTGDDKGVKGVKGGENKNEMSAIYTWCNVPILSAILVEWLQNSNLAWEFDRAWKG